VLQLTNLTDARLPEGSVRLELAILSFMEQFRKIYVGDQVSVTNRLMTSRTSLVFDVFMTIFIFILFILWNQVQKTSKVYRRLSETLRLNDESMVLSVFIRKM
jgi:exportin-7